VSRNRDLPRRASSDRWEAVAQQVGARIKAARDYAGVTQSALASRMAALGISLSAPEISRIENGQTEPPGRKQLDGIAEVLGVSRGFLEEPSPPVYVYIEIDISRGTEKLPGPTRERIIGERIEAARQFVLEQPGLLLGLECADQGRFVMKLDADVKMLKQLVKRAEHRLDGVRRTMTWITFEDPTFVGKDNGSVRDVPQAQQGREPVVGKPWPWHAVVRGEVAFEDWYPTLGAVSKAVSNGVLYEVVGPDDLLVHMFAADRETLHGDVEVVRGITEFKMSEHCITDLQPIEGHHTKTSFLTVGRAVRA